MYHFLKYMIGFISQVKISYLIETLTYQASFLFHMHLLWAWHLLRQTPFQIVTQDPDIYASRVTAVGS